MVVPEQFSLSNYSNAAASILPILKIEGDFTAFLTLRRMQTKISL